MAKNTTPVSGNTVRSFLLANPVEGVEVKDSRGRLPKAGIEAYEAANPGMVYTPGFKDETKVSLVLPKEVTGKSRNGKTEVTVAEARALAGDLAGERGILTAAAIEAAGVAFAKAQVKAPVEKA